MNPDSATLRSTDLCILLSTTDQSLFRWLARPYPLHHVATQAPKGRTYALPEIVARLRDRRHLGLHGDDLAAVVTFDTETRAARDSDFLWLGDDAQDRAATFYAALDGEETERARDVMKVMRRGAMAAGLTGVNRLAQIVSIQPGIVRFILTGENDELPVGSAGWQSFTKAIWAINPIENYEVAA